jgi:hypothetical protein
MKKIVSALLCTALAGTVMAQELYVFSEPASNMPARSLTVKGSAYLGNSKGTPQRYTPEVMLGISSKFMVHAGTSFSNMHSPETRWESIYLYAKYRFLSVDEVHRHFRMALFADGSYSRNDYHFDEVSIQGDRSGVQLGIIATQLINKLAVSGTVSHIQAFDPSRKNKLLRDQRSFEAINYSLSAGYLVLPFEYTGFNQLNMNLYIELLGQRTLDRGGYYNDLAPAIQFIFNSNSKLNIGYRFQLGSNQFRGMTRGFLVSFEHSFFNFFKKRQAG